MQWHTRRTDIALAGLTTLAAVSFDVYLSLDPDNYFHYGPEDRQQWVYPAGLVALTCALMVVEMAIAVAALMLKRPRALWLRCLLALALLGPWALFSTMLIMHGATFIVFQTLWVWLLTLTLAATAIGSAAIAVQRRLVSSKQGFA
jgi:hypothetical protein